MNISRIALIVAGGKGERMKTSIPKQFIELQGKPVLMHTMNVFFRYDPALSFFVVLPTEQIDLWKLLCQQHHFDMPHQIVSGGETRFHSVKKGIEAISHQLQKNKKITNKKNFILVAIHDGVRPFVSTDTIDRCFEEAEKEGNAIPAVELTDSIRKVSLQGNEAEERRNYRLIQTPQVFEFPLLQKAYQQQYSPFFTDDASVVEAMGVNIHLVEGNYENIKITTSFDLELAEFLLSRNESSNRQIF